ncbi:MAG: shikimate dehydrogenase [Methylobacterium sp.]|nr:MAG: shikimate dehydrogenase [Methylobacterium sp.]
MTDLLDGTARLILHLGYPTESFRAPLIYNPYFASLNLKMAVIPMGLKAEDFDAVFPGLFRLTNVLGALVTMPHKIRVREWLAEASPAVKIAGSCNAVLRRPDGSLAGDMFDGEGFVRAMLEKGETIADRRVLILGAGGVGSAIAAAFAAHGARFLRLHDPHAAAAGALAERLAMHYPAVAIETGPALAEDCDVVVNATPLGMSPGDPMPIAIESLPQGAFVGDVVMKGGKTAFLKAAEARGHRIQLGIDMLYAQIPAYLAFFGLPVTDSATLRRISGAT